MIIADELKHLLQVIKVANDDLLGNTARLLYGLNWKEGLSARNQAHKILDELALTDQIIKGKGFYAVKGYQGQFKEHDRKLTEIIARLITLKFPISIHREVSFPVGLRADAVGIVGKENRATCFWLEVCDTETDPYFNQKAVAIRNNRHFITECLTDLFATRIPDFTLVVHGKSHPEAMDFQSFVEAIR